MSKITDRLNGALSTVTAVLLTLMMVHIVAHALLRFFFNSPLYGTNEIVQYWYLPLVALLGIPAAQLQKQHITVTLVTDRLTYWSAAIFKVFAALLGVAISLLWARFGLDEALQRMSTGATAGVTDIIIWPVYFLVPLTFLILAALYVYEIVLVSRKNHSEGALVSESSNETDAVV